MLHGVSRSIGSGGRPRRAASTARESPHGLHALGPAEPLLRSLESGEILDCYDVRPALARAVQWSHVDQNRQEFPIEAAMHRLVGGFSTFGRGSPRIGLAATDDLGDQTGR